MRAQTLPVAPLSAPRQKPASHPVIRRLPSVATPKNDLTTIWLNRAVTSGFLAIALYLTAHFSYAFLDNAYRFTQLSNQQAVWQHLKSEKLTEHVQLTQSLQLAQSPNGLEAMARNTLQLVENEEVLVRFH